MTDGTKVKKTKKIPNLNKPKNIKNYYFTNLIIAFLIIVVICTIPISIISYRFISRNLSIQANEYNQEALNRIKWEFENRIIDKINETSLNILCDLKDNANLSYIINYPINDCITKVIDVKDYIDVRKSINSNIDLVGINFSEQDVLVTSKFIRLGFILDKTNIYNGELQYFKNIINDNIIHSNSFWVIDKDYPYYLKEKKTHPMLHFIRNYSVTAKNNTALNASIIISISYKNIEETLMSVLPKSYNNVIIADSEGKIIYHKDMDYIDRNIADFKFIPSNNESSKTSILNNEKYEFTRLINSDWTYIIATPIKELKNVTDYVMKIIIMIVLLTIVFGALLSIVMAKKLSNPIKRIVFKWKDMINEPNNINIEISFIENIMDTMSKRIVSQAQKIKDAYPIIKSNFLRDLISGKIHRQADIEKKLSLLGYNLNNKKHLIMIVKNKSNDLLETEKEYIVLSVLTEDYYKNSTTVCISSIIDDQLVILFNTIKNEKDLALNVLSIIEDSFMKSSFIIGIGAPQLSIASMKTSYEQAKLVMEYSFYKPVQNTFIFAEIENSHIKDDFNDKLILDFKNKLNKYNDIDEIFFTLNEIFKELRNEYFSLEIYPSIINTIIFEITELIRLYNLEDEFGKLINYKFDNNFESCWINDINQLQAYIFHFVEALADRIYNIKENKYYSTMEQAVKYIDINIFDNQLSLKSISEHFEMSPNYFSRQFKNVIGKSFIKYISEKKIEEVKKLLIHTDCNLDEISKAVGYSTPQYLINKFKSECGITPSEYRLTILSKLST